VEASAIVIRQEKFRWAGTRPQGKGSLLFRQLQFVLETQSEFIEEISEHGAIGLVVAECFGFPLEGSFQLLLGLLDLIAECLGLFQDARAQVALYAGNLVFELRELFFERFGVVA
jgi:hypothetical protein